MELTTEYANGFINYIRPFADGFRHLAALPDDVPAVKHKRGAYYRPQGDENKYGAWIVKTHIKGTPVAASPARKSRSKTLTRSPGCHSPTEPPCSRVLYPNLTPPLSRPPRCGRRDRRQVGLRIFFIFWRCRYQHLGTRAQSARMGSHPGRLFDRIGRWSRPVKSTWRPGATKPAQSAFLPRCRARSASNRP